MEPLFPIHIDVPRRGSRERTRSLHAQLQAAIVEGRLRPGLRMPATRMLATMCGLSRNAVVAAYETLVVEGLLTTRRGAGTFVAGAKADGSGKVTQHGERNAPTADARIHPLYRSRHAFDPLTPASTPYDFRIGIPDHRWFPFDIWRRLISRNLRSLERTPSGYHSAFGRLPLREALAAQVSFSRAVACRADDIIVTAGAQQAFDLLARILVVRRGTVVALENPGYPSIRTAFLAAGARVVPVPVDAEGLRVDMIPDEARVVCVTPSHQYPLGSQLSQTRRVELMQFARQRDAVVIEDDYDGEFRFRGRPLDALKTLDRNESVFYIGTFSKSLLPSLRMGYVVAPPWALQSLAYAKQSADWHSATLMQNVLAAFIAEGHLMRHLRRMRTIYERRSELLLASLGRHFGDLIEPFAPTAGLHLVALCRPGTDMDAIASRCQSNGIALRSLSDCWVGKPSWPVLGLGFGALHEEHLDTAVRKLRQQAFP